MITCYTACEIWRMTDVIFTFRFVLIFALLPPSPQQPKKSKQMNRWMDGKSDILRWVPHSKTKYRVKIERTNRRYK